MRRINTVLAVLSALVIFAAYVACKVAVSSPIVEAVVIPRISRVWWLVSYSNILIFAAMVALMTGCMKVCGIGWTELGWSRQLSRRDTAVGLWAGFTIFVVLSFLRDSSGRGRTVEPVLNDLDFTKVGTWAHWILATGVLTGIGEELLYRGAIVGFLSRGFGGGIVAAAIAATVSGLFFAIMHPLSGLDAYVVYGGIGVFLSLVYLQTNSLRAVMLAHVVANCIPIMRAFVREL